MQLEGKCHCGNIRYVLDWRGDATRIPARTCGCAFCTKHGGSWTSHPGSALSAEIRDASHVSKYRFGTGTADFHVCARCGAVPFVTSTIDDRAYAVVNVNTLEGIDPSALVRTAADFDGEDTEGRLERRKRNWIPTVRISAARASPSPSAH
jgi:hypothetical protein